MRKHRIMLTAAIVALTLLVSCIDRENKQGRVTLTFWHSFVSSTLPALEDLISRFESEYPPSTSKPSTFPPVMP